MKAPLKLVYFAWVRGKIGCPGETVSPPETVRDVSTLLDWLESRGPGYAEALRNRRVIRAAVNQEMVPLTHPVVPGDEVALFPPVSGG